MFWKLQQCPMFRPSATKSGRPYGVTSASCRTHHPPWPGIRLSRYTVTWWTVGGARPLCWWSVLVCLKALKGVNLPCVHFCVLGTSFTLVDVFLNKNLALASFHNLFLTKADLCVVQKQLRAVWVCNIDSLFSRFFAHNDGCLFIPVREWLPMICRCGMAFPLISDCEL